MNEIEVIPKLLKLPQVAEILQVSRTQAYRLAATGELPSVRFGVQTVRVRLDDLQKFINENRRNGDECVRTEHNNNISQTA
jgi:excisionase family DNA binding protein